MLYPKDIMPRGIKTARHRQSVRRVRAGASPQKRHKLTTLGVRVCAHIASGAGAVCVCFGEPISAAIAQLVFLPGRVHIASGAGAVCVCFGEPISAAIAQLVF